MAECNLHEINNYKCILSEIVMAISWKAKHKNTYVGWYHTTPADIYIIHQSTKISIKSTYTFAKYWPSSTY